jgi:hypothetical protein
MIPLTKTQQLVRFARLFACGTIATLVAATIWRIWQLPL